MTATIKEEHERSVSRGGNSPVVYLPKKYFSPGEKINSRLEIETDGTVRMVITKKLFNFNCDGVRDFVAKKFNVEYDKTVAGTRVLNAVQGNLGLNCTQSTRELEPTYVTVSRRFNEIKSAEDYAHLLEIVKKLSESFDAYIEPEGDLDSLNVYREPTRYGLEDKMEAIAALRENGKKLDFSVIVRFDNKKNEIEDITTALKKLTP
jgi:hypothetical protein